MIDGPRTLRIKQIRFVEGRAFVKFETPREVHARIADRCDAINREADRIIWASIVAGITISSAIIIAALTL